MGSMNKTKIYNSENDILRVSTQFRKSKSIYFRKVNAPGKPNIYPYLQTRV